MAKSGAMLDPEYVGSLLATYRVTFMDMVPSVLSMYMDLTQGNLPSTLRQVFVVGEACRPELVEQVRAHYNQLRFTNHYGPAEATSTHRFPCKIQFDNNGRVPIGSPLPNVTCYVFDLHANHVAIGTPGELMLGGVQLSPGYAGRCDLTQQSFRYYTGQRLYHTGDRVRWLGSGDVEFLGRIDFQIKLNGQRVEASEIETVIREIAGVRDALVQLKPLLGGSEHLAAYVLPANVSPDAVRSACSSRLPGYMVPSVVV